MRGGLTSLLLFAMGGTLADASASAPVALTVKPMLCITDKRNPACDMSLLIAWESDNVGDYCLYSDRGEEPISCWARESSGRVAEQRLVDQTYTYWLTNGDSELRVAEAVVEVLSADSGDRRQNRRRRHAWSVL